MRIVFNAAMKAGKASLNDCLFKGPKLNELLADVLMRFRLHKVVFMADIKQAFLRVGVKEGDRDFLRFLWVQDISADDPVIEAYRFTTLVFGLTCSPLLLNATLKHHLDENKTDSDAEMVEKNK